jgi:hypothetical protein
VPSWLSMDSLTSSTSFIIRNPVVAVRAVFQTIGTYNQLLTSQMTSQFPTTQDWLVTQANAVGVIIWTKFLELAKLLVDGAEAMENSNASNTDYQESQGSDDASNSEEDDGKNDYGSRDSSPRNNNTIISIGS